MRHACPCSCPLHLTAVDAQHTQHNADRDFLTPGRRDVPVREHFAPLNTLRAITRCETTCDAANNFVAPRSVAGPLDHGGPLVEQRVRGVRAPLPPPTCA